MKTIYSKPYATIIDLAEEMPIMVNSDPNLRFSNDGISSVQDNGGCAAKPSSRSSYETWGE